jgi:DNA-binding SARP family transcriptional activator/tetratricopeptide (TPR) repeat protein
MPAPLATLHLSNAPHCQGPDGATHELGAPDAMLLAWLALEGATPRERLAALLWPGSPAEAARNALRQRLFRLRRQTGLDLVDGQQQLALAPDVEHDLDRATTLLGTLAAPGDGEFASWLQAQRQRLREGERQQLASRIDALEAAGDPGACLPLAQQLLALDPLSEDAHRRLIRLHYLAGDRAAALRAFDHCEQVLKDEVGTRPSAPTLALLATLEQSGSPVTPAPTPRRTLPAALMRPPRLVGRDAELTLLRRIGAQAGCAVVLGDAGLGKSRLLQALADTSPGAQGALHAAGRPGDALAPYATLGRALRDLARWWPQALDAAPSAQLAPLLPERVTAGAPRSEVTRAELLAALLAVLRPALQRLRLCLLDDLHFADTATLELLPDLLAGAPDGAWVLSLRPPAEGTPQAQLLQALAATGSFQTLALAPLGDEGLAALVDSLALPGVQGAALAPALRARSGGNPLFALETLKLAWHEGLLAPGAELPRPQSVGQLIERSLQALSPDALLLARLAAVAGVDFEIALAEQLLQRNALQLADAWGELEQRQVLRGTGFAHDLVHERVLAGVPEVLARHTHGQVALWLEARAGEPARTAAHWEAAGQPERALPALRQAAERAHAALRENERVDFLVRAADIAEAAGRSGDSFDLVAQAVEAHMNTIRDAAGYVLLARLDRLARSPLQRARALCQRAWYCTQLADLTQAIATGTDALALIGSLTPESDNDANQALALQASVQQRLGTALAMASRFDEALPLLLAAQPWMDAHGSTDTAAEFHGNLATVFDNLGRVEEARERHLRVIEATRSLGDHSFHATALANHAVSRLNAGDVAGALESLHSAQQLVAVYELKGSSAGFIAALQAQAARVAGRYIDALAWCDNAEALLAGANPAWLPVVALHRAQTWLDLGQWARAQQVLQGAADAPQPERVAARRLMLLGRLQRALGQREALASFDAALARAPQRGWPELRLSVRVERAAVLPASEARAELTEVVASASPLGLHGVALAAWLRLGALATSAADAATTAAAVQALLGHAEPGPLYRGERWLGRCAALAAAGDAEAARQCAREGLAWVAETAQQAVPEPFRDAFLQRHPVNLALATAAQASR